MPVSQFPEEREDRQIGPNRTRLEEEVLEILQRTDTPLSMSDHVRRKVAQERRERARRWSRTATSLPQRLGSFSGIFGFAVLGFLAFVVRDLSPLLATILAIASVVVLLIPIISGVRSPRGSTNRRWRGRDMDSFPSSYGPSSQPAWFEHLRQRFRRPPRL